ncbi:NIF3-like protein 1 [Turdus rufiventris]|nr:NIF3-like protein 1 [Turdus rufiventris]
MRLPLLRSPLQRLRALGRPPVRALMNLRELVSALNDFAPPSLAENWDNVGLLVEPSPPHTVNTLFLTNDLTEEVMEEAVQKKADLVLSYHPPIFTPLKRVTWKTWKERLVVRALENRIGIYSPHTAYDAVPHGVNNWLAKGLESPVKKAALCAGSGSSVLKGTEADLYLTGEMSHHDVLDAVANGISVILCEHSNTERGFLSELRDALAIHLQNKINIIVSEKDRDPLQVA